MYLDKEYESKEEEEEKEKENHDLFGLFPDLAVSPLSDRKTSAGTNVYRETRANLDFVIRLADSQ